MTSTTTITRNTFQDYIKKNPKFKSTEPKEISTEKKQAEAPAPELKDEPKPTKESTQVSISDKAKELAGALKKVPTIPPMAPPTSVGPIEVAEVELPADKIEEVTLIKKPSIFFISGFELFNLSSKNDGIRKMAESIPGAREYSWRQKQDIIDEIKKRDPSEKLILVGHSLGGDAAVEIANELNTIDSGFRVVDLVITIDSVGMNNDIIPQNVKTNFNFFGEKDLFLNDGPNVARDIKMTDVINELRVESHTDLDDSNEVQYKILYNINKTLKS